MKLKKPSVKFSFKPNWKKLGLIFISSIFSAIILSIVLIAIPQTENYLKTIRYDLVQSPTYWQKSYSLQLEINQQDEA
ncbi:MAG TPA: hypothetical protein VHA74_00140, partial [Candidatus Dojkabacteria bacterium]|nr:hypothetical protein [Candidatus Dojkabacteria bacterium]